MIYNESKFNSEWDTLPLNKLGEFKRGKSKHRPRNDIKLFRDGKYPLVQTGEIKAANLFINSHNATYNDVGLKQSKLWDAGTLCITIAANIAETGILAYPMCFPDSCVGFVADKEMTSELFMHYVFTFIRKSIQTSSLGSIQNNINIELLTSLDFKIPSKNIQDNIVALLLTIDKKIETNNSINNELEAMAKTIYNYWFVQFDFPNEEGKPYKASGGEMEWNEDLKREIPKGWDIKRLDEAATVKAGGDKPNIYSIEKTKQYYIPIYSNGIVNEGLYGYTNEATIQKQSITVSARGTIGYCVLRNKPFVPIIRLIVVTPNIIGSAKYIHEFLKSVEYVKNGSVQQQLTVPEISSWNIIIPQTEVLKKFDKITSTYIEKIDLIKEENQELIILRDFLLPLLMNGQVKVK